MCQRLPLTQRYNMLHGKSAPSVTHSTKWTRLGLRLPVAPGAGDTAQQGSVKSIDTFAGRRCEPVGARISNLLKTQ